MDFWISQWISGFSVWISGFQFGFLPTVYEISFVTDPRCEAYSMSSLRGTDHALASTL